MVLATTNFGRLVQENTSQGTDRGPAGPAFVIGALAACEGGARDYLRLPRRALAGVGRSSLPSGSSFWMVRASRMTSRQDKSST
jgi:uncharacterized protein (DUF1501 family)